MFSSFTEMLQRIGKQDQLDVQKLKECKRKVYVLLLGFQDSGKSTFLKALLSKNLPSSKNKKLVTVIQYHDLPDAKEIVLSHYRIIKVKAPFFEKHFTYFDDRFRVRFIDTPGIIQLENLNQILTLTEHIVKSHPYIVVWLSDYEDLCTNIKIQNVMLESLQKKQRTFIAINKFDKREQECDLKIDQVYSRFNSKNVYRLSSLQFFENYIQQNATEREKQEYITWLSTILNSKGIRVSINDLKIKKYDQELKDQFQNLLTDLADSIQRELHSFPNLLQNEGLCEEVLAQYRKIDLKTYQTIEKDLEMRLKLFLDCLDQYTKVSFIETIQNTEGKGAEQVKMTLNYIENEIGLQFQQITDKLAEFHQSIISTIAATLKQQLDMDLSIEYEFIPPTSRIDFSILLEPAFQNCKEEFSAYFTKLTDQNLKCLAMFNNKNLESFPLGASIFPYQPSTKKLLLNDLALVACAGITKIQLEKLQKNPDKAMMSQFLTKLQDLYVGVHRHLDHAIQSCKKSAVKTVDEVKTVVQMLLDCEQL